MAPRSSQDAVTVSYGSVSAVASLRWIRLTTTVSVVLLAVIAAVISYRHMHTLALEHGESRWTAALTPFSVDGMVVASSMSILMASRTGRRREWLPWTLLIVGSLASLAANVAVAEPSLVGRMIAAWPSFAFVGAYHMLQGQLPTLPVDAVGECGEETGSEPEALGSVRESPDGVHDSRPDQVMPSRHLQRQAWQWAQANRSENGELPAGTVIARRFNRSPRWGRLVKNAGIAGSLEPSRDGVSC